MRAFVLFYLQNGQRPQTLIRGLGESPVVVLAVQHVPAVLPHGVHGLAQLQHPVLQRRDVIRMSRNVLRKREVSENAKSSETGGAMQWIRSICNVFNWSKNWNNHQSTLIIDKKPPHFETNHNGNSPEYWLPR